MAKVLVHKVVVALPSPLDPDSIYYVRKGAGFEIHVTNGVGEIVAYSLNASADINQHIGATGTAHGIANTEHAGFMSPDHARFLDFFGSVNNIGQQGSIGFGVGICPALPPGMSDMTGTMIKGHDNYGNYQYQDGSIMCWVPAFFYRYGHASNSTYTLYSANSVSVLPRHAYPSVLAAGVAGYALHRSFWDDGVAQPGVFVDKYKCSNNSGTASSVKNGNPLSSAAAHNPFSGLTGSPPNNLSGAIPAVKTRGADFFPTTPFIQGMLALLSLAHGQSATSSAVCAWYDATGVSNFPKGCNNNALRDVNDTSVIYESTGHATYPLCGKTGSGQPFAKTTHNGQACGVADINGLMWEINPGLTYLDGNYYILSPSARAASLTPGFTLPADAWGAAGMAATHLLLGPSLGTLGTAPAASRAIGSASQVLSSATDGLEWAMAGAGIPLLNGTGGTNLFGNDRFYDNNPQHMCTIACGVWDNSVNAGPWARLCNTSRAYSHNSVGVRAALYLVKRSDSE